MKQLSILLAVIFIISLCSCGSNYSPMDSYVQGVKERAADSARHANEVDSFLRCEGHTILCKKISCIKVK